MAKEQYLTAPIKTDKMPPGIPYIVGNEAAERFSYYGVNGILVMFMTTYLMNAQGQLDVMNEIEANKWYHYFVTAVYGLPLLGAVLADAVLGKYRTVFWLSIVYCFGHFTLALNDTRIGLLVGLSLIALGAGGIKPCVSANVGDQFGPLNQGLLQRAYTWFYFSINIGSVFATILIPILLHDKRFGPKWAFGMPGVAMLIATVVFFLGRRKFVHIPPAGFRKFSREFVLPERIESMPKRPAIITFLSWLAIVGAVVEVITLVLVTILTISAKIDVPIVGTLGTHLLSAILLLIYGVGWRYGQNWVRWFYVFLTALGSILALVQLLKGNVEIFVALPALSFILIGSVLVALLLFLPRASQFFSKTPCALHLETMKCLGNLLIPIPFVAMFWALWQQNFSSWVKQAEKLDRNMFGHEWLPEQIQTVNPGFVLLMLPLFSYVIYPILGKVWRLTPLRKIGIGLFTNALAFTIVALIQQKLDAGARPHVVSQILAFVVLTAGEVMVSVTHLEFAYTQAPKKLKSLVMCTYLGAIALGNVFTAQVNSYLEKTGQTQITASYFWFFVKVMLVTAVLWLIVSPFYRGKSFLQEETGTQSA